ncbi:UNVERIFIED_CONTAM: hypothetical protein FKN15_054743 [Acipenser sinensis]
MGSFQGTPSSFNPVSTVSPSAASMYPNSNPTRNPAISTATAAGTFGTERSRAERGPAVPARGTGAPCGAELSCTVQPWESNQAGMQFQARPAEGVGVWQQWQGAGTQHGHQGSSQAEAFPGGSQDTLGLMLDTLGLMQDTLGLMQDTLGLMQDTLELMQDMLGLMLDTLGLMLDTLGLLQDTNNVISCKNFFLFLSANPSYLFARVGQSVSIPCVFDWKLDSTDQVRWFRDNASGGLSELSPGECGDAGSQCTVNNGAVSLTIQDPQRNDSGRYYCAEYSTSSLRFSNGSVVIVSGASTEDSTCVTYKRAPGGGGVTKRRGEEDSLVTYASLEFESQKNRKKRRI